jgi:serine/threonine protein kinase
MAATLYCAKCLTTFFDDAEACPNLTCGAPKPKKGGWGVLLGAGDLLDRHYLITKPLAVGGAGLTYLAREVDGDGQPQEPSLAIKVLYNSRDSGPFLQRLSNEAQILQQLAHEHIVECRGFVHRTGQAPYLVTKFEHGGSLSGHVEKVGALPPRVAAGVLRQVLLALDVAHQRGVVHRDLKPENVLLSEPVERDVVPHCRVADFGIAKVFGGVGQRLTRLGAFVGTPEYAAPEQFEGLAPTPATDVFAAGGLLVYLRTGQPPVNFQHRMDVEASYDELLKQLPPRMPPDLPDPEGTAILQDVVNHTMCAQAGDRWTVQQVLARIAPICPEPQKPGSFKPVQTIHTTTDGRKIVRPDGTLDTRSEETFTSWNGDPNAQPEKGGKPPKPPPRPPQKQREGTVDSIPVGRTPTPLPPTQGPPPPPVAKPAEDPIGAPSPEPPPPRTASVPAPARRGGAAGTIAGLAGMLLLLGGSVVVAGMVLAGGAFAFGWFTPPPAPEPVTLATIALTPPAPIDLDATTDAALVSEREAISKALDKRGANKLREACDLDKGTMVEVGLTIGPEGHVVAVDTNRDTPKRKCVERELGQLKLPRTSGLPVTMKAKIRVE